MLTDPNCEVCGAHDWRHLGQRIYRRSDIAETSGHLRSRLQLLFAVWASDKDQFQITSILCNKCGFLIYLPRPQMADLDAKYRWVNPTRPVDQRNPHDHPIEIARSDNIWRYLASRMELSSVSRVLDYGGMDGRLMRAFRMAGKDCYLVDYCQETAPGVTKLAETIHELDPQEQFELIVCSHVLEHVAEPKAVVEKLLNHLAPEGRIFIEVPMEIWRKPPLPREPVTHINFFTPNSLYNLLLLSGTDVEECAIHACPHPMGVNHHGIRALGTANATKPALDDQSLKAPDALRYIKPSIARILYYYGSIPSILPRAAATRIKKLFSS